MLSLFVVYFVFVKTISQSKQFVKNKIWNLFSDPVNNSIIENFKSGVKI